MKILLTWAFILATAHAGMAQRYELSYQVVPYRELDSPTPLRDDQNRLTSETRLPIYDFFFPLFGDTMTSITLTPHFVGFQRQWEMGAVALAMDIQILENTEIAYSKEGPQGAQILTLQWKNAGFGNDISKSDYFDAQLTLDEQTGCIKMQYGPNRITYPERYVGLNFYRHSEFDENPTHATGLSGMPEAAFLSEGGHLWGAPESGALYDMCPAPVSRPTTPKPQYVRAYPNPANDVLHALTPAGAFDFKLFDAQGRLALQSAAHKMEISALPPGLYLWVAEELATGRRFHQKIIKQ